MAGGSVNNEKPAISSLDPAGAGAGGPVGDEPSPGKPPETAPQLPKSELHKFQEEVTAARAKADKVLAAGVQNQPTKAKPATEPKPDSPALKVRKAFAELISKESRRTFVLDAINAVLIEKKVARTPEEEKVLKEIRTFILREKPSDADLRANISGSWAATPLIGLLRDAIVKKQQS